MTPPHFTVISTPLKVKRFLYPLLLVNDFFTVHFSGLEGEEETYQGVSYTSYSADVDGVKKSNISMSASIRGEKRTIKIGKFPN